jgi:acyl-coenzyme A synthetase/AMP-(fatty) acid ligase
MTVAGLAGGTQGFPLTLTHLLGRAKGFNGDAEAVTVTDAEGTVERTDPASVGPRAEALAGLAPVLDLLGDEAPAQLIVFGADAPVAGALDYEQLIERGTAALTAGEYTLPELDERSAAALCYTSGTTGDPKGSPTRTAASPSTRS